MKKAYPDAALALVGLLKDEAGFSVALKNAASGA